MADISSLTGLQATDPIDWDQYTDAQERPAPPAAGRYTVQAPPAFPKEAFGATKAGALSATIDPTIIGPDRAGMVLKYTRVSAKTFKRGKNVASQLGDYLRACGISATINTPQQQADAVESTAGLVYQVDLDWEAYHSGTGFRLKGMTAFPKKSDGSYDPWAPVKDDKGEPVKDDQGQPVQVRANVRVERFVPAGA